MSAVRPRVVIASILALAVGGVGLLAACVGDDPAATTGTNTDGGPGATVDGGGNDANTTQDGGTCPQARCANPSTLANCDGTQESCTFGCSETNGAHCQIVYPTGLLLPGDLSVAGTSAVTIPQSVQFTTDTGAIENLRQPNVDPLQEEVKDGIGFRLATGKDGEKLAIWSFESLTIPDGVTIRFTSTNPVAFAASKTVTIAGVVDARGYSGSALCSGTVAGPGGFAGGGTAANGQGPGAGLVGATKAGAGGGGYAAVGGKGGPSYQQTTNGGDGGAPYGNVNVVPLIGGSGGAGSPASNGGGGGGAIQIAAIESITIGGGVGLGGINAGGCQGGQGGFGSTGGAGGSGGAIVLETRTLTVLANGHLAATGGGGASGGTSSAPTAGGMEFGGTGGGQSADYSFGGLGASGGSGTGTNPGGGGASAPNINGAGAAGGGSVGRIRINNRSGSFTPGSGQMRPDLGQTTNPAATVGTLDVH